MQQPLLRLVARSQNADPAAAFDDGQPDPFTPVTPAIRIHLYDESFTTSGDHAVVVANLTVT